MAGLLVSMMPRLSTRVKLVLLAGAFFFVLFARRFEQLLQPQVWDEDGRIIREIVSSGPLALVQPLNGYLVIAPTAISIVAMVFPLEEYALVSTIIAWCFIVGVVLAVALSPTMLRGGPLLAVAVLLVPSNPEVFGIPLYTLWWASILVLLATLWEPGAGRRWWRIAFIIVGGLSSPLVLLAFPVGIIRAVRHPSRTEWQCAALMVACAAVQGFFLLHTPSYESHVDFADLLTILRTLPLFAGAYPVGNLVLAGVWRSTSMIAFEVLAPVLALILVWRNREEREVASYCLYLWIGAAVLSCARVDPNGLDPVIGGPRYFFIPFVLEGWLLIQVALRSRDTLLRYCAGAMLVLAAFNALPVLSRTHDDLSWKANIARCAQMPGASTDVVPIELAGSAAAIWTIKLSGYECRQLDRYGLVGLFLPK